MAAAGEDQTAPLPIITDMESFVRLAKYPLVKFVDMTADMREEAVDIISVAVDKHVADMEKCSQQIIEKMEAKFGGPFHCVCGEAFAFRVTHEVKNMIYLFTGPDRGVLLWKL